mgnify:FL=1
MGRGFYPAHLFYCIDLGTKFGVKDGAALDELSQYFFHELIAIKQRVVDRAHCDQVYQQAAAVIRHDIACI